MCSGILLALKHIRVLSLRHIVIHINISRQLALGLQYQLARRRDLAIRPARRDRLGLLPLLYALVY
jgi:hypothetical protein